MNLLFVSYNAPPVPSARSTRLASIARWLVRRGHRVQVFTVDLGGDDDLMLDKLAGIEVLRVPPGPLQGARGVWTTSGATRRESGSSTLRARAKDAFKAMLVPDPGIEWAVHLVRRLPLDRPDAVVSFVPPFSGAVVGYALARRLGARHVIDYGDPWTLKVNQKLPPWRVGLDERLERYLVRRAAGLVFNAPPTLDAMRARFPEQPRAACVLSGFDPDEYAADPGPPSTELRHLGSLYDIRLPLAPLEEALADHPVFRGVAQYGRRHYVDLPPVFEERPQVPYREALRLMQTAGALLLLGNRGSLQIPSKLYNYLGSGRPVLAMVESMEDPVARLDLGPQVVPATCETRTLRAALDQVAERMDRPFDPPAAYRWEELTAAYERLLEAWVSGSPAARAG